MPQRRGIPDFGDVDPPVAYVGDAGDWHPTCNHARRAEFRTETDQLAYSADPINPTLLVIMTLARPNRANRESEMEPLVAFLYTASHSGYGKHAIDRSRLFWPSRPRKDCLTASLAGYQNGYPGAYSGMRCSVVSPSVTGRDAARRLRQPRMTMSGAVSGRS